GSVFVLMTDESFGGGGLDGEGGLRGGWAIAGAGCAAIGAVGGAAAAAPIGAVCGDVGGRCGPLGGTVLDARRGGSWMPVGGALRAARARGGSGGKRRPHAWHTARSSLFSALQ